MDDLQTLVATILGALLILVAVWQIAVRRTPDRNTAKFLGIEFDLSTPGLVVLAAGCGLLVLPAFLPHRPIPSFVSWEATHGRVNAPATVLQQQTVLDNEHEPNDAVGTANRIELGQTIKGTVMSSTGDVDYFVLNSSPETRGPKRIIARTRAPGGCCFEVDVWNQKEILIAHGFEIAGKTISLLAPAADAYLIRLSMGTKDDVDYELVIAPEPPAR